jgi:hypothetical protein
MSRPKIVWNWTEWSEDDIARVWLPQLHLSRLAGKTSLYLAGDFTAYDPPRLTSLARDLVSIVWDVAGATEAMMDRASEGAARPEQTITFDTPEALFAVLDGMFACGDNYVVRLGPFVFAEQDGDMLDIEAPLDDLQRLFDTVASHADAAGWTFIDVVDD